MFLSEHLLIAATLDSALRAQRLSLIHIDFLHSLNFAPTVSAQ